MSVSKQPKFNWERVDQRGPDECWPWKGFLNVWGYGQCRFADRTVNASRAAFIAANGGIAEGLVVCHRCDNPACCNPAHLFAATQAENLADCRRKGRQRYRTGVAHHRATARLTEADVREIKRLSASGMNNCQIARQYGVHNTTVRSIVVGETWRHVA